MKEKLTTLIAKINDNSFIDLADFSWTQDLTDLQKLFVFYYCLQNSAKKNASEAARSAGFSVKNVAFKAYSLLANPKIQKEIKNINAQLLEKYTKSNIEEVIKDIIERKIKRLNYSPLDFYDIERIETDEGTEYTNAKIKLPSDLTQSQKELIEDVEFVGQKGIAHYKLPSKIQAENELLKIYKDLKENSENTKDFDVETTAEIIGEKIKLKTKIIKENKTLAENSDLSENNATEKEEED